MPKLDNKSWLCAACNHTFYKSKLLEQHARQKKHEAYRCTKATACLKSFNLRTALIRHERSHSEHKKHACSRCSKTFHRRDHHQEHETICKVSLASAAVQEQDVPRNELPEARQTLLPEWRTATSSDVPEINIHYAPQPDGSRKTTSSERRPNVPRLQAARPRDSREATSSNDDPPADILVDFASPTGDQRETTSNSRLPETHVDYAPLTGNARTATSNGDPPEIRVHYAPPTRPLREVTSSNNPLELLIQHAAPSDQSSEATEDTTLGSQFVFSQTYMTLGIECGHILRFQPPSMPVPHEVNGILCSRLASACWHLASKDHHDLALRIPRDEEGKIFWAMDHHTAMLREGHEHGAFVCPAHGCLEAFHDWRDVWMHWRQPNGAKDDTIRDRLKSLMEQRAAAKTPTSVMSWVRRVPVLTLRTSEAIASRARAGMSAMDLRGRTAAGRSVG